MSEQLFTHEILSNSQPHLAVRFYGGITCNFRSIQELPPAFRALNKVKINDVAIWNSELMAKDDAPIPNRAHYMAVDMNKILLDHHRNDPEARYVGIVHSLGGAQYSEALRKLRENAPHLLKERINNFDIILPGTTALDKGVVAMALMAKRFHTLLQSFIGSPITNGEHSVVDIAAGIESFCFIPPQTENAEDMLMVMSKLFPNRFNGTLNGQELSFPLDNRNFNALSDEKQKNLRDLDTKINRIKPYALQGNVDAVSLFESLAKKRARLINNVLFGSHIEPAKPSETPAEYKRAVLKASELSQFHMALQAFRTIGGTISALYNGKLADEIHRLLDMGMDESQIKLLVPYFDVFRPKEAIQKVSKDLSENDDPPTLYNMENSTHASWILFSDTFAKAIEQMYVKEN